MKNLVFIAAHNNQEATLPYGIQSWRWYCKKYNIDFLVSNKSITSDFKVGGHCAYEKWNENQILNSHYNKILIVDSDIIVRWDTPNIFDTFPNIEFGMVKDQGGASTGKYHLDQWKNFQDISNINPTLYCNSGFLILNYQNYKIVHQQIKKYFSYWKDQFIKTRTNPDAIDQTPVNIIGWKDIGKIDILPEIWNNMIMTKYDDASFINDSYIWHFTGPKMGGWGNKASIMRQIWESIKDNYSEV
jgi:alpha-N-acetylglucosamine transferase